MTDNQPEKASDSETSTINVGMHVVLDLYLSDGSKERLEFDLVEDASADFAHGFLGAGTPIAKAILNKSQGEKIAYSVNDIRAIKILHVEPAKANPPEDLQERRCNNLRQAVESSDRTNAMIFASSFSGKWGDYDPTGFVDLDNPGSQDEGSETDHSGRA